MAQLAILDGVSQCAAFLFLDSAHGHAFDQAAEQLDAAFDPKHHLIGLGVRPLRELGHEPQGFRPLPTFPEATISTPATPSDVMIRITGNDPGEVLHRERALLAALPSLQLTDRVDTFMHRDSRDLSGYIDGTENPEDRGKEVAFAPDGSSVLALQRWTHDLDAFARLSRREQDHTFGRDRESNEELDDAPTSAHVKRTAQEDFSPEAFVLRRSMPWRDHRGEGLVFLAFGATLDPFEALLRRMVGLDDGVVDALFGFTRPTTGGTWWCPPLIDGHLEINAG